MGILLGITTGDSRIGNHDTGIPHRALGIASPTDLSTLFFRPSALILAFMSGSSDASDLQYPQSLISNGYR